MQLAIVVWALLAVFVASRFADFVNRLLSPDMAAVAFAEGGDDAYYYFTIARNIGNGTGITIDGEHWTTGFQPLWQLMTGLAFIAGSDRIAFAFIYLMSFACWVAGLLLFIRFIRGASKTPLTPATTALVAVLFLCETHVNRQYFNGLDTGLATTLGLGLMVAFQRHLQSAPAVAGAGRLLAIGVLAGLFMLARNDGVFLCATLIGVTFLGEARPHPFREASVIVAMAAVLVIPWLVYCQLVWGYPMPQSGVATSTSLYGHVPLDSLLRYLAMSLVPTLFVKAEAVTTIWPVASLAAATAAAAAIAAWRLRDRHAAIERSSRLVLLALTAACVLLVAYYEAVSSAGQFFARYFMPLRLLVLILVSLFAIHAIARFRVERGAAAAILVASVVAIGSNSYWVWRDYGLPYRSYFGFEAYEIARSPYGKGSTVLGAPESGRLGFLYPTRIVNLDGKARVDALRAMQERTMAEVIKKADLDYLLVRDYYVDFYDKTAPGWRDTFKKVDELGFLHVFANTAKGH
jgi:hypothetical protein